MAVTEKKKVWVKPDRKMTMEELWERFEYDPDYVDDDPAYEAAIYDRYGNPTYGTLCAMYEDEHDIGYGPYTIDELFAEFDKWREEATLRKAKHGGKFKRDYKRAVGRDIITHPKGELWAVIYALENGIPLPERYHDHPLHNNLEGFRECYIRTDLLLIYAYVDDDLLRLERLGTHSEIFGL